MPYLPYFRKSHSPVRIRPATTAVTMRYQGYCRWNKLKSPRTGSLIFRTDGPHCQSAYFWITSETPNVARMVVSGSRPISGRSVDFNLFHLQYPWYRIVTAV